MYLKAKRGLGTTKSRNPMLNTIDAAMEDVIKHFHVDLAGHYDFDEEIHTAVHRFIADLPIDPLGYLRAGEYRLPDGRLMLLISDVHLCLMADSGRDYGFEIL